MAQHIMILCPVLDDGDSFTILQKKLSDLLKNNTDVRFSFLVVDDGSVPPLKFLPSVPFTTYVLPLKRNIGHQKAIAIGFAYIRHHLQCDKVLVMDSDGEDRPEDAMALLHESDVHPGKIIFAFRKSRQEGTQFLVFYKLYKILFFLLTGRKISFGHFLVLPFTTLDKIVYYSETWNHIPGAILKSGLPYTTIETHRGKRYAGVSKMNFTSLLLHGLGAIAVFIDVIATRLLIFSMGMISIALLAILIITFIRLFTDLAIPGWASTVVSSLLIVLLQSFLLSLFTIFLYLSSQSQRKFIPAYHYKDYTGPVETLTHG